MGSSNSFPRVNDLTQSLKKTKTDDDINASDNPKNNTSKLFAIGCGFGKDDNPKQSITKKLHCIDNKSSARNFGEDAAFIGDF